MMNEDKTSLRQKLRIQRRAVSADDRDIASQSLLTLVMKEKLFQPYQHIACYVSHDGEIDPLLILNYAWELGKSCYLPIIAKNSDDMHFIHIEPQHALVNNHYGILEPIFDDKLEIPPQQLDIVLVPLVAFDKNGHRLGRGKGYYDKCFAFLKSGVTKPFLLGLAYQFQYVEKLPAMSHDIPLNAILTEQQVYHPKA